MILQQLLARVSVTATAGGTPIPLPQSIGNGDIIMLATLALAAGINHLAIGFWAGGVYTPAAPSGTLWEAMQIVPVEDPE